MLSDEFFMNEALKEAQKAFDMNEVPVGAVVVSDNMIIARGHNQVELLGDVTAHAEILAYTAAAVYLGNKLLSKCTMYVTLEPCPMCAGALYAAQLQRLVFGAFDIKRGYSLYHHKLLHPATKVTHGVLAPNSSRLMKDFFSDKRD